MNIKFITIEEYQELKKSLEEIKTILAQKEQDPKNIIFDNDEFIKFMKISRRTAATWRSKGIISYSQVLGLIYYRMSDIQIFLDHHYNKSFKKPKR